jgi:hypothetical protein
MMYYSEPRPNPRPEQHGRSTVTEEGSVYRRQIDCSPRGGDEGPRRLASRRGTPQREWLLDETHDRA